MAVQFFNTPIVEGRSILSYKGFVSASQVAGTGFLTDFVASFSDFFGGNSGVYRSAMNDLCENVLKQLEQAAISKGANAVVGLHLDFDNISAKGTSMFMVSAQGTAVVLGQEKKISSEISSNTISSDTLEKRIFLHYIVSKIRDLSISEKEWQTIINYADTSLADALHATYINILGREEENILYKRFIKYFRVYFTRIPFEKQIDLIYHSEKELNTIKNLELFDAKRILKKAREGKLDFAIKCLECRRKMYTQEDMKDMEELYTFFTQLPDVGQIVEVKGGVFSSGGKKFICASGHKNNPDVEYCTTLGCGKNIKGLTKHQVELINALHIQIEFLKEMFAQH